MYILLGITSNQQLQNFIDSECHVKIKKMLYICELTTCLIIVDGGQMYELYSCIMWSSGEIAIQLGIFTWTPLFDNLAATRSSLVEETCVSIWNSLFTSFTSSRLLLEFLDQNHMSASRPALCLIILTLSLVCNFEYSLVGQ